MTLDRIPPERRRNRFCAVFAPFSTVSGNAPGRENADTPGFCRVGRRQHRSKTAETVETVGL
jgi:hypothetical protein